MDRDFHIQVQLDSERVFHHRRGRAPQDREGCLALHKCPGSECGGEQASPWRQGGITGKSGQGRHLAIVLLWLGKFPRERTEMWRCWEERELLVLPRVRFRRAAHGMGEEQRPQLVKEDV